MKKQEHIKYLQEELGAAEYHLWALKKGLYKVHGLNDTPKAWEQKIQALETELETLLNEQAEPQKPNLKEEVQSLLHKLDTVRITGNTVQKVEIQPEPEEVEKISELTKEVDGIGTVTASYYENSVNEYIKFESEKGNALWCTTLQGWAAIRDELPITMKEKIFKVFSSDLDRLGPAPQPDPPQPPVIQVVDPEEINFWQSFIEKSLQSFKNNGRLRTSWKAGDTCYKEFNRQYNSIWNIPGYSDKLEAMQNLAAEMWLNRTPELNMKVLENGISEEEIEEAKKDIQRIERRES